MTDPAYKITGGPPVRGEITCLGAKNFASKAMVAACLGNSPTTLLNMPPIGEVDIVIEILESLGATTRWEDETTLFIDPTGIQNHKITLPDSRRNRIPILFLPVLLHRFQKAEVPHVEGDKIGARKVDFHTTAAELFGAHITEEKTCYKATSNGRLQATHYDLPYPSVGATETCLYLSVLAQGTSVITNAAVEPEIIELITMLRAMGAIIFLGPNREIRIKGVEALNGTRMYVLGDRIEAASWACLACASDGDITVHGIRPNTLGNFLSNYRQIGGGYDFLSPDTIRFYREKPLTACNIETDVYPGFSTDWMQPFAVVLTQAEGMSAVHETVYENRMGFTEILNKLGAKIQTTTDCLGRPCRFADGDHVHSAHISGPTPFKAINGPLKAPDIRAGLAYLIAAAIAEGETILTGIDQLERGYGDVPQRLAGLTLEIEKV